LEDAATFVHFCSPIGGTVKKEAGKRLMRTAGPPSEQGKDHEQKKQK
jgi:hypothetical protein